VYTYGDTSCPLFDEETYEIAKNSTLKVKIDILCKLGLTSLVSFSWWTPRLPKPTSMSLNSMYHHFHRVLKGPQVVTECLRTLGY
jgi:hypothetical protein